MEKINLASYLLDRILQHDQNKIAITDDNKQITYKELPNTIRKFASLLRQSDLRPGDRVGMLMGDSIEWVVAFFATLYVGGVPILINPKIPKTNLQDMLEKSNVRIIITSDLDVDLNGIDLHSGTTVIQKTNILTEQPLAEFPYKWHPDEMSLMCSSSGTSGRGQRFVVHRHGTLFDSIKMNVDMHGITSSSVLFSTPKLSFNYGLMDMVYGLVQGGHVILSNKIPSRVHVCNIIKSYQVTHFYTTPTIVASMIKIDEPSTDLNSVLYLVCGGETLPKFVEKKFNELYNKLIFNGIGMSEILTWATSQNLKNNKFGTIGVPLSGVECEVRKASGELCQVNEMGELYIKQSTMALMYWNSAQHSKETFVNGWFKTRDLVYWDEDGYLIYVCRNDDLIRIKESYVNPFDIEEEILQHPAVEECVVISEKNKLDMPEICSKIVLKNDQKLTPGELRAFLKNKLELHKVPKHIDFVEAIPKTVTTKKIRNRIKVIN